MSLALLSHIRNYFTLDETEAEAIASLVHQEEVPKKATLLKEGQVCQAMYFVETGLLRSFYVNEKGVEQTCQFALENWWLTDYLSLDLKVPTHFHIQAVEHCSLSVLTKSNMDALLHRVPKLERYFRLIAQRHAGAQQVRIRYLFSQSGEERYHHFNNMFPEFVQRIPQYMLASYLGFTPEFLSKIRAGKT